jgi:hypothetical protein
MKMAKLYYPNRVFKGKVPAIDRQMAQREVKAVSRTNNIAVTGVDYRLSNDNDWQIDSIAFEFSNAVVRDYSVKIMNGRRVVTNWNDYLWFGATATAPQIITLGAGFYTGTELAAELQKQLNGNAAFIAIGVTFTVVYAAATGLYTITPSAGDIIFYNAIPGQTIDIRDSIAGHLFGLTATTTAAASVTSDTAVFGLNTESWIIDENASIVTEHYHDDVHVLSMDQAVHVETSTAAQTVTFTIRYEDNLV